MYNEFVQKNNDMAQARKQEHEQKALKSKQEKISEAKKLLKDAGYSFEG